jgi:WD40 repeat protein
MGNKSSKNGSGQNFKDAS